MTNEEYEYVQQAKQFLLDGLPKILLSSKPLSRKEMLDDLITMIKAQELALGCLQKIEENK